MEKLEPKEIEKSKSLLAITGRKFFNFLGYMGVMFILYGAKTELFQFRSEDLDKWVAFASSLSTLIGTILTACSVYIWRMQPHAPERFSRYISAPLVILGAIVAMLFLITKGDLPISVITGFAPLAISGALFRIQPHTVE